MSARRARGAVLVVLGLILAGSGAAPPAVRLDGLQRVAATTNHAAIVIDTGSEVKKFCLAFPEASISGAEALRRVDAQPVFASFGGSGEAVCSLCGTGCPSSNCFCDPKRFWAYHRAGPGGAPYSFSRAGASSTAVRNGDVEGWRWGSGEAPPAATVSEVCNVEEPPARTAAGPSGSSTTTSEAAPKETTATTGTPATTAPGGPPTTAGAAPDRSRRVPPVPASDVEKDAGDDGGGDGTAGTPVTEAPPGPAPAKEVGPSEPEVEEQRDPTEEAATSTGTGGSGGNGTDLATTAVFTILLAAILAWRAKLRRAKVRRRDALS